MLAAAIGTELAEAPLDPRVSAGVRHAAQVTTGLRAHHAVLVALIFSGPLSLATTSGGEQCAAAIG